MAQCWHDLHAKCEVRGEYRFERHLRKKERRLVCIPC